MAENTIFNVLNRLIDATVSRGQVDTKEKRFYIPSGTFTPTSAIFGTELASFTGADSLQLSTVYACVSKISDSIASMDGTVLRRTPDGDLEPIENHPVSFAMSVEPNVLMGAYEFKQLIISDMLLYGVGYGYIDRRESKIYWLPASDVTYAIDKNNGDKYYHYPGAPTPVPSSDMIEIKAFRSLSPTRTNLKTMSTAKSLMDFGNKFFENGGMLGGILTTKEPLDEQQMLEITKFWKDRYAGAENAHKVAILGGGFTYQPLSVPLDQLQYIDSKKYSSEEICRVFQMPPAMVGMDTNTTYSNYEQQVLQYMQGCIAPRVRALELEITRKLLSDDDSLYFRFDMDSMMRADFSAKSEYYKAMSHIGVLSINDIRRKEGMQKIDSGDYNFVQVNQIPVTMAEKYAKSIVTGNEGGGNNQPKIQGEDAEGVDNKMKMNNNNENTEENG